MKKMRRAMMCLVVTMVASMSASVSAGPPPDQVLSNVSGLACGGGRTVYGIPNQAASVARGGDDSSLWITCGLQTQHMVNAQGVELRPNTVRIIFSRVFDGLINGWCIVDRTAAYSTGSGWTALLIYTDMAWTSGGGSNFEASDVYMADYDPLAQYAEHAVGVSCLLDSGTAILQIQQLVKDWQF
jgi:hypothetical protein